MADSKLSSGWKLFLSIIICEGVGIGSALLSSVNNNEWFASLNKPSWNPPGYLFGPVWTTLYLLMGIALWLIWKADVDYFKKNKAISIFLIQLFFNFCWSIFFFRFHNSTLALIDILFLLSAILITIANFYTINKKTIWLLLPYLMWVSFATFLNFTIWKLN